MKRWRGVVVTGLLVTSLVGCSGDGEPEPTVATTTSAEPTQDEPTQAAPVDNPWCESGEVTDEAEVTFGEISAASDEWSQATGRTWRHYIPVTITNVSDKPCFFQVKLDAAVEGGSTQNEDLTVPLQPGQSYHLQAFELEGVVDFSADAEDATPAAAVTPSVYLMLKVPLVDFYEAELDVKGITGEGAGATLVSDITVVRQNPGLPQRPSSAGQDKVYIHGLDAAGDVITKAYAQIDPIPEGETFTLETGAGGGNSSGEVRNQTPLSAYDDVVSWQIGAMQPDSMTYPED